MRSTRAAVIPAFISCTSVSTSRHAGPSVHTILDAAWTACAGAGSSSVGRSQFSRKCVLASPVSAGMAATHSSPLHMTRRLRPLMSRAAHRKDPAARCAATPDLHYDLHTSDYAGTQAAEDMVWGATPSLARGSSNVNKQLSVSLRSSTYTGRRDRECLAARE